MEILRLLIAHIVRRPVVEANVLFLLDQALLHLQHRVLRRRQEMKKIN